MALFLAAGLFQPSPARKSTEFLASSRLRDWRHSQRVHAAGKYAGQPLKANCASHAEGLAQPALCPEPNLGTLYGLAPSHKPQRSDADPDTGREDGPQSREAGHQSRAGGKDIVNKDNPAYVGSFLHQFCCCFSHFECSSYILCLSFYVQLCLSNGPASSCQQVGAYGYIHSFC